MRLNEFMKIGDNFKAIRKKKNITQLEMANLLDLPRSTYANYESNKRTPSSEELERISKILKVPLGTLITPSNKGILFNENNKLSGELFYETLENNSLNRSQAISSFNILSASKSIHFTTNLFKLFGYKIDFSSVSLDNQFVFIQKYKNNTDIAKIPFNKLEEIANSIEFLCTSIVDKTINDFSITEEEFKRSDRYKSDSKVEIPNFLKESIINNESEKINSKDKDNSNNGN